MRNDFVKLGGRTEEGANERPSFRMDHKEIETNITAKEDTETEDDRGRRRERDSGGAELSPVVTRVNGVSLQRSAPTRFEDRNGYNGAAIEITNDSNNSDDESGGNNGNGGGGVIAPGEVDGRAGTTSMERDSRSRPCRSRRSFRRRTKRKRGRSDSQRETVLHLVGWGRNDLGQLMLKRRGRRAAQRNGVNDETGGVEGEEDEQEGEEEEEEEEVCAPTWSTLPSGIINISAGPTHSLCVTRGGRVFGGGDDSEGQLAGASSSSSCPIDGTLQLATALHALSSHRVVHTACGGRHSLVLRDDGTVFSFGLNESGQLGHGTGSKERSLFRVAPRSCPLPQDMTVREERNEGEGEREGEHQDFLPPLLPPRGMISRPMVVQVVCGEDHSLILTRDGEALSCGSNSFGQVSELVSVCHLSFFSLFLSLS